MDSYSENLAPATVGNGKHSAVFAYALWIQHALLSRPVAPVPDIQWQEAVGRRLLTPAEKEARCRYFERKANAGLALTH
ncbi:MAG: hypothetical protein HN350_21000 [Phycisphaerales bacterium]|jgi:hypothetical protein|nr:hypothetical protein [Phycisphaerales bacterium]